MIALIGHPVAGNPAQFIFSQLFAHHDLDWRFLSFDVAPEETEAAVHGLRVLGFDGGCVAPPFQEQVLPLLNELEYPVALAGAVDGFVLRDEGFTGFHAKSRAVADLAKRHDAIADRTALILGEGPLALATAGVLAAEGLNELLLVGETYTEKSAQLLEQLDEAFDDTSVCDTVELSERLPNELAFRTSEDQRLIVPSDIDLVVWAAESSEAELPSYAFQTPQTPPFYWAEASDSVVYVEAAMATPLGHLMSAWEGTQRQFVTGLDVLVEQAIVMFRYWTGFEPNPEVARDAAEEYLEL